MTRASVELRKFVAPEFIIGAVHAMAHSLGGYSNLPRGECNALLLEHVAEFNFDACPGRYAAIGAILHPTSADKKRRAHNRILSLLAVMLRESPGVTGRLSDLGVTKKGSSRACEKSDMRSLPCDQPKEDDR
jgi:alcohol dehydrogenase